MGERFKLRRKHRIAGVETGSIAEELGIQPGDLLVAVNGQAVEDVLDYMEWMSSEEMSVTIEKGDGQVWELDIEKDPDEDLGLIFEQPIMDRQRACCNRCIFCFIDQLPRGMRSTLYYKDDDWRLSFLMGNYITLTNLTRHDIERIISKRISPLYISVHTTNPQLRRRMMGNERAGEVLQILKEFEKAGISIHCQIVLCRNWNDGAELERTLSDLWSLRSIVSSVAVVPVGLTKHRQGLESLVPFDAESAARVLEQVKRWQKMCRSQMGTAFVFAADEFYILAGKEFPSYEEYEDFPQIENGVGLIAKLVHEFEEAISDYRGKVAPVKEFAVATGVSAYPTLKAMMDRLQREMMASVHVYPIVNRFFGESVTVAGLITGGDIIAQLEGKDLGKALLIPCTMLRRGEDVFLDDVTLEGLSTALGVPVVPVQVDGNELLETIANLDRILRGGRE